jgi:hypothetical protein
MVVIHETFKNPCPYEVTNLGDAHCKCWDANMPLLGSFCSLFCYYDKDSTIKFYLLFKALACCIFAYMEFELLDFGSWILFV